MLALEITIAVMFLVSNVLWFILFIHKERQVTELSKLLASRTFSEYSIGEARLAETRREQKEAEGYEQAWVR